MVISQSCPELCDTLRGFWGQFQKSGAYEGHAHYSRTLWAKSSTFPSYKTLCDDLTVLRLYPEKGRCLVKPRPLSKNTMWSYPNLSSSYVALCGVFEAIPRRTGLSLCRPRPLSRTLWDHILNFP